MSNKRPNQSKRDKKPALSSSNTPKTDAAPPAQKNKAGPPSSAAATEKSAVPKASASNTSPSSNPRPSPAAASTTSSSTSATTSASPNSTNTVGIRRDSGAGAGTSSSGGGDKKGNNGWIAPLALLLALLTAGFSTYIYSQFKAYRESSSLQFLSQEENSKSDRATFKTELDEKTATLSTSVDEKTATLSAALDEKSAALRTALDEKSAALSTALDEKTTALSGDIQSSEETLRENARKNTTDIATSTAKAVQELTAKTELEINNVSTSFNTGLAMLRERTTEKFSQLNNQFTELDTSVKTTNELAMRGQRDWVLAEVNYLLRTGVHRVKLAGDVKAGVIALESASDRLHSLGDINYLPVREQIAEEVAALRRVGPPDIEGLIFKLQHMSKRADTLPLPRSGIEKTKQALAEDPATTTAVLGKSLLDKFKGSVQIVSSDGAADSAKRGPKIKPTKEQLTASDSLRLHLQAARLSALRHDANNFNDHMDNAIDYSSEIFDQENEQVNIYIADLNAIKETNIVPKTPSLGSSLSLFNKIDSKRGNN